MKKFVAIFFITVVVFGLTGCGSKSEKVLTCKLKQTVTGSDYTLDSTYKAYYVGKVVNRVESTEVVNTDNQEVLDYMDEYLDSYYKELNSSYGGYETNITKNSDSLVANTVIDYNKMDLKKYADDNTAISVYLNSDNKLTIDGVKSIYEAMGASCE